MKVVTPLTPYIVDYLDTYTDADNRFWIIMEYMADGDLGARIKAMSERVGRTFKEEYVLHWFT